MYNVFCIQWNLSSTYAIEILLIVKCPRWNMVLEVEACILRCLVSFRGVLIKELGSATLGHHLKQSFGAFRGKIQSESLCKPSIDSVSLRLSFRSGSKSYSFDVLCLLPETRHWTAVQRSYRFRRVCKWDYLIVRQNSSINLFHWQRDPTAVFCCDICQGTISEHWLLHMQRVWIQLLVHIAPSTAKVPHSFPPQGYANRVQGYVTKGTHWYHISATTDQPG